MKCLRYMSLIVMAMVVVVSCQAQKIEKKRPPKIAKLRIENQQDFITFTVNDVTTDTATLKMDEYDSVVIRKFQSGEEAISGAEFHFRPDSSKSAVEENPETIIPLCVASKPNKLIFSESQSVITALALAYAQHRCITLSPDIIWLMLMQGLGIHINENSETLRSKIVDFQGKKNLDVEVSSDFNMRSVEDWSHVITNFKGQIKDNVGANLSGIITSKFSTTTQTEEIAHDIALMYSMSPYFSFSVTILCGIPQIKLEGSVEDWKKVESLATQLQQFDLHWWLKDLLPILHQFVKSRSGQVDQRFWANMYQVRKRSIGCGSVSYLDGWILKLFPYTISGGRYIRNPVFERKAPVINFADLPTGTSKAYVLVADSNGSSFQSCYLISGFAGLSFDEATNFLKPEISWEVAASDKKPSEEAIKNYRDAKAKSF